MTADSVPAAPSHTERRERVERAQALMAAQGLDYLLVSSESNYRYFTGHETQAFRSASRPLIALIPRTGPPLAFVASSHLAQAATTSWLNEFMPYSGFEPEAISEVLRAMRPLKMTKLQVGCEFGREQRLGISPLGFSALQAGLPACRWVDASDLLWRLRMQKSTAEIACAARSAEILHDALAATLAGITAGVTEREVYAQLTCEVLHRGADNLGYAAMHSGAGNYARLNGSATDRSLKLGDLLWIDAGCVYSGYWCDLTWLAAVGTASAAQMRAYDAVRRATENVLGAIQPGLPISSLSAHAEREFAGFGAELTSPGRIGHGFGLQLTEPPSVRAGEDGVLQPGMLLAIEPAWNRADGHFVTEQDVVVTENGWRRLSGPAPEELPQLTS